jgi:hypothetical protein
LACRVWRSRLTGSEPLEPLEPSNKTEKGSPMPVRVVELFQPRSSLCRLSSTVNPWFCWLDCPSTSHCDTIGQDSRPKRITVGLSHSGWTCHIHPRLDRCPSRRRQRVLEMTPNLPGWSFPVLPSHRFIQVPQEGAKRSSWPRWPSIFVVLNIL